MRTDYEYVQVCNPITKRYVLINKTWGIIVSHKVTKGPYKNVPIQGVRYDLVEAK